ncbi:hypothetical protein WA026_011953 [Henosepilachna vigintioctopunctata]|uniref:Uncharacterized protein n=1 Tax=Henosepilachna vigintioctopunctata TaxID=420089 RepID=A0AAW1VDQ4_9CUCU
MRQVRGLRINHDNTVEWVSNSSRASSDTSICRVLGPGPVDEGDGLRCISVHALLMAHHPLQGWAVRVQI